MKIIDLLNKIANGESVPLKIKYDKVIWDYDKDSNDYCSDEWLFGDYLGRTTLNEFCNDEIELIEKDKPIEKIFGLHHPSTERLDSIKEDIELAFETIDKLIDEVNKLKKESDKKE